MSVILKEINSKIKIGIKVLVYGSVGKEWDIVKEVIPGRQGVKLERIMGTHQAGHLLKFSNK